MLAEEDTEWAVGFLGGLELGRIVHLRADVPADGTDEQAEREGHSPAPGVQGVFAQGRAEEPGDSGGEEHRDALGRGLEGGVVGLAALGVLGEEGGGGSEFAAGGDALDDAGDDEADRGPDADRRLAGQDDDDEHTEGHQSDGQRQGRLAPVLVGVPADEDGAQRSHDEGDGEGRPGHQLRGQALARIEDRRDRGGHESEEDDVVPLEGIAQSSREYGLAGPRLLFAGLDGCLSHRVPFLVFGDAGFVARHQGWCGASAGVASIPIDAPEPRSFSRRVYPCSDREQDGVSMSGWCGADLNARAVIGFCPMHKDAAVVPESEPPPSWTDRRSHSGFEISLDFGCLRVRDFVVLSVRPIRPPKQSLTHAQVFEQPPGDLSTLRPGLRVLSKSVPS